MTVEETLYSYAGKILRINLSNHRISTEPTVKYAKDWFGASGIAIKILYDELRSWVSPFEPSNMIIFGAGALLGTIAPGACKSNISTLGPTTGGWASGLSDSYVGGQLKYAGYDSVIIEGKAHLPVYLWINDDQVEIRDACHLWGKTTWETLDIIRKDLSDDTLHAVSIGPAGEHLVRGACIIQDKDRAFGRCGSGAVMGSKNLKAIVANGSGAIKVANPEKFMKIVAEVRKMFKKGTFLEETRQYGTLGKLESKQKNCGMNYKNFQECIIPDDMAKAIDPRGVIHKYQVSRQSYPGCAVGCGRRIHITDGPYSGLKAEMNQIEALLTLQTRFAIWEPTFMVKANAYCNQMGLDIDAAGGAIGWAMECFQRGILDTKDTDGMRLEWGDAKTALELIRKISHREGFGDLLAEGSARASDMMGRNSSYYAMHIKGQDLYEPCRGSLGWSLGTTTSTRGGGHTTGAVIDYRPYSAGPGKEKASRIYGVDNPFTALDYDGKAKMITYQEVLHRISNCLGICHLNTIHWDIEFIDVPQLAQLYSAATGWDVAVEDLHYIAMKQLNLEKAFNLRHTDFDRKDDMPTLRDMNEPIPSGRLKGWKMDEDKYNKMLDEYYDLHGWDRETSFPKRGTLAGLGLEYVADDLSKINKLR
jgi:aldehyde:ferredoxin oxidoreductase